MHNNDFFSLLEDQSHRFAGAFLLPAKSFTDEFYAPSLDSLRSLKAKWRVSIAAMIVRANELKLVSADQAKRLWINLGRRKWRTVEPLDNLLEPERPRFLRRCFDLLIDHGVAAPESIPFELALTEKDVEDLAGLPTGYFTRSYQTGATLKLPNIRMASRNRDQHQD